MCIQMNGSSRFVTTSHLTTRELEAGPSRNSASGVRLCERFAITLRVDSGTLSDPTDAIMVRNNG